MQPSALILKKYADVLIRFALNSGRGIKRGEVVYCTVPDIAKPFYGALQESILRAGGIPQMHLLATGFNRQFYELANREQLTFFPKKYAKARIDLMDHYVGIVAEADLKELKDVDPKKIMLAMEARKKTREWQFNKEYAGKFTWTTALYGTAAMAAEAHLTLKDYWQQIIDACYLNSSEPVGKWQEVMKEQQRVINALDNLPISKLHIQAAQIDLWLTLGKERRWLGGGGRNIPSFEIFTSPDWRGTSGQITFNQPLYFYGQLIKDISLTFERGKVVKGTAKLGESLLQEIIRRPSADRVGEFSLTDGRLSKITHFMATTLFDENIGGPYGNTHIALGMAYKDAYRGRVDQLTKKQAKSLGYNDSGEHVDIISTEDRTVTAVLTNGEERVIYEQGRFTV